GRDADGPHARALHLVGAFGGEPARLEVLRVDDALSDDDARAQALEVEVVEAVVPRLLRVRVLGEASAAREEDGLDELRGARVVRALQRDEDAALARGDQAAARGLVDELREVVRPDGEAPRAALQREAL